MAFGYEEVLKAEIARLRDALDEQTGRAAWHRECLTQCEEEVIQRDAEIERLRLTDAERAAIERSISRLLDAEYYGGPEPASVVTLRGLLERLGGGR